MDVVNNVHEDDDVVRIEPEELLEESWFFGNLLNRRQPRMLRSYSDPCTSSNYGQDSAKSYDETYESIMKLTGNGEVRRPNLIKAPSMPPSLQSRHQIGTAAAAMKTEAAAAMKTEAAAAKQRDARMSKSSRKQSPDSLVRAPSMPAARYTQEFQDEEIDFSLGKLIRQASLNCSDSLPPRTTPPVRGLTRSCSSMSRQRLRKKPELESIRLEGLEEIKPQCPTNQLRAQKSLSVLESQGFKDLNSGVITTTAEAWRSKSRSAPPVPKWGGKRSNNEDMKAQIRFWARAVGSNVRQEC